MTDARIFAKFADGVVVVTRAGKTTRDAAQTVNETFAEDGTRVIGVILNAWEPDNNQRCDYGSYNDAYYGPEKDGTEGDRRWLAQTQS
jgi:Mrp family chromosome partitioning ATPase